MNKLPVYLGYLAVLPFFLFLFLSFFTGEVLDKKAVALLQLSYSVMILSFLGGVHWGQALPRNHNAQLTFSVMPTIACMGLMIWTIFIGAVFPLFAAGMLFWAVYRADKKYMPTEHIPEGYFQYRKLLTIIVSACLYINAFLLIF